MVTGKPAFVHPALVRMSRTNEGFSNTARRGEDLRPVSRSRSPDPCSNRLPGPSLANPKFDEPQRPILHPCKDTAPAAGCNVKIALQPAPAPVFNLFTATSRQKEPRRFSQWLTNFHRC